MGPERWCIFRLTSRPWRFNPFSRTRRWFNPFSQLKGRRHRGDESSCFRSPNHRPLSVDIGFLNDMSPKIIHLNELAQENTLVASHRRAIRASLNVLSGCLIFRKVSKEVWKYSYMAIWHFLDNFPWSSFIFLCLWDLGAEMLSFVFMSRKYISLHFPCFHSVRGSFKLKIGQEKNELWNHVIFSWDVSSQNSSTDESGDKCLEVKHGATWECVRPKIFHDLSEFPASFMGRICNSK